MPKKESMTKSFDLNETEKMVFELLSEKERAVMSELSLQASRFQRQVEERLGLDAGAIGTTHLLDPKDKRVILKEES